MIIMFDEIKSKSWDNRVTRTGFLQSKHLTTDAITKSIALTKNISATYDSFLWVTDHNLYDDTRTRSFTLLFDAAFKENPKWPIAIANQLENIIPKVDSVLKKTKK